MYGALTGCQCIKVTCASTPDSCNDAQRTAIKYWIETRLAGSDEISVLKQNMHANCAKLGSKHKIR